MSSAPGTITVDLDVPANRPARPVVYSTGNAGKLIYSRQATVTGWSFRETSGTVGAVLRIVDGQDNTGTLIAALSLSGGQAAAVSLAPGGLAALSGVYIDVVSGTVEGAVWVRNDPDWTRRGMAE